MSALKTWIDWATCAYCMLQRQTFSANTSSRWIY